MPPLSARRASSRFPFVVIGFHRVFQRHHRQDPAVGPPHKTCRQERFFDDVRIGSVDQHEDLVRSSIDPRPLHSEAPVGQRSLELVSGVVQKLLFLLAAKCATLRIMGADDHVQHLLPPLDGHFLLRDSSRTRSPGHRAMCATWEETYGSIYPRAGGTRRCSNAYAAASVRVDAPSLMKMLDRCRATVFWLIESSCATSLLERPIATSASTSTSRSVSPPGSGRCPLNLATLLASGNAPRRSKTDAAASISRRAASVSPSASYALANNTQALDAL